MIDINSEYNNFRMSLRIYLSYSRFLGYAKKNSWLFKLSSCSLQKRFKISMDSANVIIKCMTIPVLDTPHVIAGLLTYAKHLNNPKFWENFQYTIEYIFIEFAYYNFFPLAQEWCVPRLRIAFVKLMNNTRYYEAVLERVSPRVKRHEELFNYICTRHRGNSEHLANLIIASLILPDGLFDWNSCFRGDESENLMMFGLMDMQKYYFDRFRRYTIDESVLEQLDDVR